MIIDKVVNPQLLLKERTSQEASLESSCSEPKLCVDKKTCTKCGLSFCNNVLLQRHKCPQQKTFKVFNFKVLKGFDESKGANSSEIRLEKDDKKSVESQLTLKKVKL